MYKAENRQSHTLDKHRLCTTSNNPWSNYLGRDPRYEIAGLSYRDKEVRSAFALKSTGTVLLLKKEPSNPHDPGAVAVYAALTLPGKASYEWTKVGYVPKRIANSEFKLLAANTVLEATKSGSAEFYLTGKVREYM